MTASENQFPKLGKYPLEKRLGEGAMGVVWLGTNPDLDIKVAIKTIKNTDEAFVQRFLREARSAIMIDHFRVARIFDAGSEGDQYYIVMEYLPGGNVRDLMAEGPLSPAFALYIAEAVAEALAAAAEVGIIHRDVKPDNIMLDANGEPKLVDLGLAKELGCDSNLTASGSMMGTPAYISPEQAAGNKDIDGRADIYSLGATLFHLVTGELPFVAESPVATALAHCVDPVPNPGDRNPELPRPLCALITKMMAKDPGERYQTPDELLDAIHSVTSKLGDAPHPKRKVRKKRFVKKAPSIEDATPKVGAGPVVAERPSAAKKVLAPALCAVVILLLWLLLRPQPPGNSETAVENLQSVTFTLIDADKNTPILGFDPIPDGAVIDLAQLSTDDLNIRANAALDTEEVRFSLNGEIVQTERTPPFSFPGDANGNYNDWTPPVGEHTLTAAINGQTTRLRFTVTDSRPPKWTATASHWHEDADQAIDGDASSRWTSRAMMAGDEWFQLDLGRAQIVRSLELNTAGNPHDYPRRWEIQLSTDGEQWTTAKSGTGDGPVATIALPPTTARFIKIIQQGVKNDRYWSIHEMKVNGKSSPHE